MAEPHSTTIVLRRGSLYLSAQTCARCFSGLASVILLRRDEDLWIMPVRHAAGGGYLLKIRNAVGDRVINATDFFQEHGVNEDGERRFVVAWCSELAGLRVPSVFATAN